MPFLVTTRRPIPRPGAFWQRVEKTDGCWNWLGAITGGGYGSHYDGSRSLTAHRVAYEGLVGVIPDGLELDHLCRNTACVNPAHLEPVTPRENTLRSDGPTAQHARKTHCPAGHEYDSESRGRRVCLTCKREKMRAARARRAA